VANKVAEAHNLSTNMEYPNPHHLIVPFIGDKYNHICVDL